jgi:predicted enzyme related to lactoylglutathione lyase
MGGSVNYWLISTDDSDQTSINGAIRQRMKDESTVNIIDVPSIDEFTQSVVYAGGRIVVAKSVVLGVGYHAYCADSEGNLFGIMQQDPSAQLCECWILPILFKCFA